MKIRPQVASNFLSVLLMSDFDCAINASSEILILKELEKNTVTKYNLIMDISIVIPVFEESKKISDDVEAAVLFLKKNDFSAEIIVVDDGSKDKTAETAKAAGRDLPAAIALKVERYIPHRGKGYAVRTGIKQSCGEYVMFVDSGNCVPFEDGLSGLKLINSGKCDIAHGVTVHGYFEHAGQRTKYPIPSLLYHISQTLSIKTIF